jgi:hypothetical protein
MRRSVELLVILASAALLGCARSPVDPAAAALPNASLGVPAGPPSFVGVVVGVQRDGRVVLDRPAPDVCERGAVVQLHPDTRLVRRSGAAAATGDVRIGRHVSAWFGDAELRSCPVQVGAVAIVLEP